MTKTTDFKSIFLQLREILLAHSAGLTVVKDDDELFYLEAPFVMKNKKPLFFGSIATKKNYVSFHLMPVYVEPNLLNGVSDELQKRMQGKSCFNFKQNDQGLFNQLEQLTARCKLSYQQQNYL